MEITQIQVLYALLLTGLAMLGLVAVVVRFGPPSKFRALDVVKSLVAAVVLIELYYYGDLIYDKVAAELGAHVVQIGIAVGAIGAGALMSWFKTRNLTLYALIEVALGAASAFSISQSLTPPNVPLTEVVALVGCAVIVAGGLDNLALSQQRKLA